MGFACVSDLFLVNTKAIREPGRDSDFRLMIVGAIMFKRSRLTKFASPDAINIA